MVDLNIPYLMVAINGLSWIFVLLLSFAARHPEMRIDIRLMSWGLFMSFATGLMIIVILSPT